MTSSAGLANLPAYVDLSQYNPTVGNQGNVLSCTAWATGYYLRGWYAKRDGYYPVGYNGNDSFSPMYTYSQIVGGNNEGTSFAANLNIQKEGIDTREDYSQGDFNYEQLPSSEEMWNAANWKIAGYNDVSNPGGTGMENWVETSLASGNPVAVALPVYPEFDNLGLSTNYLVNPPIGNEQSRGGHAVFAYKYDQNGLWIENSWGANGGDNGYGELSWSFVNQYVGEAVNMAPIAGPKQPSPTPPPATPAPAPATPVGTPTRPIHIKCGTKCV